MSSRVVVIGASRGIGLALARAHGARGDEVHATARDPGAATELTRVTEAGPCAVHPLDVTSDASCAAFGAELARAGVDRVDRLVHCAGVGSRFLGLEELDTTEALRAFDTNALGALRVVRALLAPLRAARGKIVLLTSRMGSIGDNTQGRAYPYRMSKAALDMAGKNLALELAPDGVACVLVHPGWVRTDLGGPKAPLDADTAAAQIVALSDAITMEHTGRFLGPGGEEIPW